MANNPYVNKVVYGGETLINLENDTITRADVINGKSFHLPTGERTTGTSTYDADTSDATAGIDDILSGKTAYKNGEKLTGNMTNRGEQHLTLSARDSEVSIPQGYHDGAGGIGLSSEDKSALIAANIREGVTVLGITGEMSGAEDIKATSASLTPYTTSQTITPADLGDYNSITSVTVAAIAYSEMDNLAGGKTAIIGSVAPTP